ncbi:hypothetical protein MLP_49620 [Microlunatus phosphovorus NM-1]|uniref:TIGR02453 family protein n=1 Tax=Microlunatus phosphovorus (strain ATCC 700054 / DSM 10555 / JCM 9379 / NBRC 101784 / NCIMB 13414 / VKM Ac-1990 / NM-1) TaxID=1032480 RepID=F5XG42_MICPN|nr:DUF2461 domain-containing protein [Microlunatus phosphovorus]BAK37976.1 hypothetical protein MLP_49620 [Microlunatus phosphovorus NM-1]
MSFEGIPVAALDFYDDLEQDNSKTFWQAHKSVYDEAVQRPMSDLMDQVAADFGEPKLFRPYRDVRFSKDKTPYKTHQGVFVAAFPGGGWYVHVDAAGVLVGAGWYAADAKALAAIRHHVDLDGERLRGLIAELERDGWEISGDRLRTTPRGWSADHPHLDLLRHKTMFASRRYDNDPVVHTAEFADRLRTDWTAARPLVEWVAAAVADG